MSTLFKDVRAIEAWLAAPVDATESARGYIAVSQLLEYLRAHPELLEQAKRVVNDHRRGVYRQCGVKEGEQIDHGQHPLLAPFVEEMNEWWDQANALLTGRLLGQHQLHPAVVVEGDAIPGVRCVGCEE